MLSGAVVAAVLLLGEGGQVLGARLPVEEGVVPRLQDALVARLNLTQQGHDLLLKHRPARRRRVRRLRQLGVNLLKKEV